MNSSPWIRSLCDFVPRLASGVAAALRAAAPAVCLGTLVSSLAPFADAQQLRQPAEVQATEQQPKAAPAPDPNRLNVRRDGPAAEWIWADNDNGPCVLEKRFRLDEKPREARVIATSDNEMTLLINGKTVATSSNWESPRELDAARYLQAGENRIEARVRNAGGIAGFALKLAVRQGESVTHVVTDASWKAAAKPDSPATLALKRLGKMGTAPWGNVFANPQGTAASSLFQVLPDFQIELLYRVDKPTQGSWVSLAVDPQGRLLASDQGGQGIWRITPAPLGGKGETVVEKLDLKVTSAQGMLCAFDSLYLSVNGGPGSGLYRARDTNGDDQYDELKLLKPFRGGGEHGPHALRLTPDGKGLLVIAGNHTDPPEGLNGGPLPQNWSEDLLLPRQWDARGHARGKLAPGGWICRTDPEGANWEIWSAGYRNPYDMDLTPEGELFAYDADMEWDMGTPWYRPTRVVHAVSGSEFGWRSGTGKWPTYYVDSLPPIVDVGPGSPTGVTFGTGAKFPARYQRALFLVDWTFGTMYAIHLTPDGASYRGTKEEFLGRAPLPLTDVVIGRDGAMYFTVGGRGTQSALYRVTYTGKESTAPASPPADQFAALRKLRRELERFHRPDPQAVAEVWPHLGHDDRHIRYAARVALEHQPWESWRDKALAEANPRAQIQALVALARQGGDQLKPQLLDAYLAIDFAQLDATDRLAMLRGLALVFTRMGAPDQAANAKLLAKLDSQFPADTWQMNRELSRVLVYLNSPTVIGKCLKLLEQPPEIQEKPTWEEILARNGGYGGTISKMLANQPDRQKIHYALVLRNMKFGWTLEQRKQYFQWLNDAGKWSGGASYEGFLANIRKEALENATEAERKAIESAVPPRAIALEELPKPEGPGKAWTVEDLLARANELQRGRNFEQGRKMFAAAQCIRCHRFAGEGGATGPDLTNTAGRFSMRDLVEATILPSKVISDQYAASIVTTEGGKTVSGRVLGTENGDLLVLTDPVDITKIERLKDVEQIVRSKVSLMPEKLLNELNAEEVLDLFAFLLSRGNPNAPAFR